MVKQSPFQHDLFDFQYIEDQVAAIKNSNSDEISDNSKFDRNLTDILDEQLSVLNDIQYLLTEIDNNTRKRQWFKSKD